MRKTKWEKTLDKFFDVLENDMRSMSTSERKEAFEKLTQVFNDKIVELKRHQSEVEYGQHVEGLHNINAREAYLYDGGWKFHC